MIYMCKIAVGYKWADRVPYMSGPGVTRMDWMHRARLRDLHAAGL